MDLLTTNVLCLALRPLVRDVSSNKLCSARQPAVEVGLWGCFMSVFETVSEEHKLLDEGTRIVCTRRIVSLVGCTTNYITLAPR